MEEEGKEGGSVAQYVAQKISERNRAIAVAMRMKLRAQGYMGNGYNDSIRIASRGLRVLALDHCLLCGDPFFRNQGPRPKRFCTVKCQTAFSSRIRARRIAALPRFNRIKILERDNWTCQICGAGISLEAKRYTAGWATVDHIVPISKGGNNDDANLRAACWKCNASKAARLELRPVSKKRRG